MYGIYANIWGILMVNVIMYSSTMDPMGSGNLLFFVVLLVLELVPRGLVAWIVTTVPAWDRFYYDTTAKNSEDPVTIWLRTI